MKTKIFPEIFALTTSVPFGIRCVEMKSQRLLTTFRNPNIGLGTMMRDWGILYENIESSSKRKIFEKLYWDLEQGKRGIIIGPLNMGKLFYIPLCTVFEGVGHYIMIRKTENEELPNHFFISLPCRFGAYVFLHSLAGFFNGQFLHLRIHIGIYLGGNQ